MPISGWRWRSMRAALRDDLRVLVMSATIDGARVARLLDEAPVVESLGRAFPVETLYRDRDPAARLEDQVAAVVLEALRSHAGSVLVFLPGQAEIGRVRPSGSAGGCRPMSTSRRSMDS